MKYYGNIQDLERQQVQEIFKMAFNYCNKVNIYFPHQGNEKISQLKESFVSLTTIGHIDKDEDDSEVWGAEAKLKDKEGFSMLIATLSRDIQTLIVNSFPLLGIHMGLLDENHIFLYLDADGEIIIESSLITADIHPILYNLRFL